MKKFVLPSMLVVLMCLFVGCSKDDDPTRDVTPPIEQEDIRYYVKYEVYMPLGYSGQETSRRITFVSEKGVESYTSSDESWERTYGPLKEGTLLSLNVQAITGGRRTYEDSYARIYVSRDKEPFVIKAEQTKRSAGSLSISYRIDF